MSRDYHAVEPKPGESVLLANGARLVILAVGARTELGYLVTIHEGAPEVEIFRGGRGWLAVGDMFDYEGVPFTEM